MLAYILAIRKWDNNGITNRGRFQRLQISNLLNVSANRIQFFLVGNELNEKNCWLKIR